MIVKRIGIVSLAKIMGILYAAIGLLVGIFFSFFAFIGSMFGARFADSPEPLVGIFFGFGAIFALPIMYGVLGFVGGIITAGFYNLIARLFGGLELELEEKSASAG